MPQARRLIAPTSIVLAVAAALSALSALNLDWTTWRPATCLPDACFCEAIGDGAIRQPINTWSNLAFVWVGVFIAISATSDRSLRRPYALILAAACVAIGLGSWFYHASLSFVGQWFDVMSMYLLGTFMVLYAAARLNPMSDRADVSFRGAALRRRGISRLSQQRSPLAQRFLAALGMTRAGLAFTIWYLAINFTLGVLLIVWPEARRYLFGVLIASALIVEAIIHRRKQTTLQASWLIAALGVYVAAQVIWTLDLNHIVCDPTSVLQGHAVWHVLTALSALVLYEYYQSEVRMSDG